jgi:hypothetical protein
MITVLFTGFFAALGVVLAGITFLTALKLTELALDRVIDIRDDRKRKRDEAERAAKRLELLRSGKPW